MKIIICGAGQVGYGIADRLSSEGNDVSVIDSSAELVQNIQDKLDVRGYHGHGSHPDTLALAGADQADMIIAVTLHDEVNMVACQVAHSLFSVPTKIARIRSQSYRKSHWQNLFAHEHMPIDVIISPEVEVAEVILRRISLPGARDIVPFAEDRVHMLAIDCDEECPVIDTPLNQLSELFPDLNATIVGILRNGQMLAPRSSDQILLGDLAYVITERSQVRRTLGIFGKEKPEAGRIIIAGGGNIGVYLASRIEELMPSARVKIIEQSRDVAISMSDDLDRSVILHGSALDEQLLMEAGVKNTDLMVSITNDDQVNILSCVLAKKLGCKSNLALLNNSGYHGFTNSLGIDNFINPRSVTISRVLQHVRRGRIRGVYSLHDGSAEIIEAEALDTSPLVGKPLKDLELPSGVRIGAIIHDDVVLRPTGETVIKPKDRIIMLALSERVHMVEQMFRVSLEFF
ncbi:MAG: Trk system potassium transporter TrkA [Hyphomicrobiales bacterium]|nr:Trk system potassium transporter TrkA [Hyphomicrobiales bacterium]PCH50610.1 MAG: Trk system potassium transporter TrkA [Hyphomicrobiales bacterium]